MNPTVADRNLNPGNLKNPSTGSFHQFSSEGEGYAALMNDLQGKVNGTSKTGLNGDSTLYDFSQKYAPSSDKNDPAQYTVNLANRLKVRPDTKISELKTRIPDFAQAVAANEGYTPAKGFKAQTQTQQNNGYINTADLAGGTLPASSPAPKKDFLEKAGDVSKGILNVTGGNKVANLFGSLIAQGVEKTKGAFGGQDNSKYVGASTDEIDPLGTALDAGKLGLTLLSLGGLKNLGNKYLPSSLNPTLGGGSNAVSSLNSPAQIVQDLTGASADKYGSLNAVDKANSIQEALSVTSKGADRIILQNALQEVAPQVLIENGIGSFSDLHPVVAKTIGLTGSALKSLLKVGLLAAGIGSASSVANRLLPPQRQ